MLAPIATVLLKIDLPKLKIPYIKQTNSKITVYDYIEILTIICACSIYKYYDSYKELVVPLSIT
jgi:hypothetical protein